MTTLMKRRSPLHQSDILFAVMMHIRPRHLLKLMLTGKTIYTEIIKNQTYFQRLAVHVLYRPSCFDDEQSYFMSMNNTPHGYNDAMESFCLWVRKGFREEYHLTAANHEEILAAYNHVCDIVGDEYWVPMQYDTRNAKAVMTYYTSLKHENCWDDCVCKKALQLSIFIEDSCILTIQEKRNIAWSILDVFNYGTKSENLSVTMALRVQLLDLLPDRMFQWQDLMKSSPIFQAMDEITIYNIILKMYDIVNAATNTTTPNYSRTEAANNFVNAIDIFHKNTK